MLVTLAVASAQNQCLLDGKWSTVSLLYTHSIPTPIVTVNMRMQVIALFSLTGAHLYVCCACTVHAALYLDQCPMHTQLVH